MRRGIAVSEASNSVRLRCSPCSLLSINCFCIRQWPECPLIAVLAVCCPWSPRRLMFTRHLGAVANVVRRCNRFDRKGCVSCIFWLARAVLAVLCSLNEARLPKTWGFLKKPMRQIRYLFVTFAVRRHVAPVGQAKKSLGLVEAGKSQALDSSPQPLRNKWSPDPSRSLKCAPCDRSLSWTFIFRSVSFCR